MKTQIVLLLSCVFVLAGMTLFAQDPTQIVRTYPFPEDPIDVNGYIAVAFSKNLTEATISGNVFFTDTDGNPVPSTIEYSNKWNLNKAAIRIYPQQQLEYETFYLLDIKGSIEDEDGILIDGDGDGNAGGNYRFALYTEYAPDFEDRVFNVVELMINTKIEDFEYCPDKYDLWPIINHDVSLWTENVEVEKYHFLNTYHILDHMDLDNKTIIDLQITDQFYLDGQLLKKAQFSVEDANPFLILDQNDNYVTDIELLFKAHFYFSNKPSIFQSKYYEELDDAMDKINRLNEIQNALVTIRNSAAAGMTGSYSAFLSGLIGDLTTNFPKMYVESFMRNLYQKYNGELEASVPYFSGRDVPYQTYEEVAHLYYLESILHKQIDTYIALIQDSWRDEASFLSQLEAVASGALSGFSLAGAYSNLFDILKEVIEFEKFIIDLFKGSGPLSNFSNSTIVDKASIEAGLLDQMNGFISGNLAIIDILYNYSPELQHDVSINKSVFEINEDIDFNVVLNDEFGNPLSDKVIQYKIENSDGILVQNGFCETTGGAGIYEDVNAYAPETQDSYKIYGEIYNSDGNTLEATTQSLNFNVVFPGDAGISLTANPNPVNKYTTTQLVAVFTGGDGTFLYDEPIEFIPLVDGSISGGDVNNFTDRTNVQGLATIDFVPDGGSGTVIARSVNHPEIEAAISLLVSDNANYDIVINLEAYEVTETNARYRINIRVYTPDGDEADNVTVNVSSSFGTLESTSLVTDGYGRASTYLNTSASGEATISAEVNGAISSISSYFQLGTPESLEPIKQIIPSSFIDVNAAQWSKDGSKVAISIHGTPNRVEIYETANWNLIQTVDNYPDQHEVFGASFSPDGNQIVIVTGGEYIIYDLGSDQAIRVTENPDGISEDSRFTNWYGPTQIFTIGNYNDYSNSPFILNPSTLGVSRIFNETYDPEFLKYSHGRLIYTDNGTGQYVKVYNSSNYTLLYNRTYNDPGAVAISPDNSKLAISVDNDFISVHNASSGSEITRIIDTEGLVFSEMEWSSNEEYLAGASRSSELVILKYNHSNNTIQMLNKTILPNTGDFRSYGTLSWNPQGNLLMVSNATGVSIYSPIDQIKPQLTISSPLDGTSTYQSQILVSGNCSDASGIKLVHIICGNQEYLIENPQNGDFSESVDLQDGSNNLQVICYDNNSNSTEQVMIVTKSQDTNPPIINAPVLSDNELGPGTNLLVKVMVLDDVSGIDPNSVQMEVYNDGRSYSSTLNLYDNGLNGDAVQGDHVYSVSITSAMLEVSEMDALYSFDLRARDQSSASNLEVRAGAGSFFVYDLPAVSVPDVSPETIFGDDVADIEVLVTDHSDLSGVRLYYKNEADAEYVSIIMQEVYMNVFQGSVGELRHGNYSYSVLATDAFGYTSQSAVYDFNVNDRPPQVVQPLTDLELLEDCPDQYIALDGVFVDGDNDDAQIEISVSGNSNPTLVQARIESNTLILSLEADQTGDAEIELQAISNGLSVNEIFNIQVLDCPEVDLGTDLSICRNSCVSLLAGDPGPDYLWSTGSSLNQLEVCDAGSYSIEVSNEHCTVSDVIVITEVPPPNLELGDPITVCEGETVTLDAGADYDVYGWNTGDITRSIDVVDEGTYILTVSDGICDVTDDIQLTFEDCTPVTNHFTPVWYPGNGVDHMNFYVTGASIEGLPMEAGDEIAVFDEGICVGVGILIGELSGANYLQILVSKDDEGTPEKDGYAPGNAIQYRLWDQSESEDLKNVTVTYQAGANLFEVGSYASITINGLRKIDGSVSATEGWNMLSIPVVPDDVRMISMVQALIDAGSLVKIQDEKGNAIEDVFPIGWVDNIGDWSYTEGYKLRVNGNVDLQFRGSPITLPVDIVLNEGWNIIGWPSTEPQDATTVLADLTGGGTLIKAQDETGNAIENVFPIGWVDNIHQLEPGEGYKVKMGGDATLQIDQAPPLTKSTQHLQILSAETERFLRSYPGKGHDHMNIYLTEILLNGMPLQAGDELSVFDGEICVGAGALTSTHTGVISLTVSLDDPATGEQDGYVEGHGMEIRIWSKSHEEEIIPEIIFQNGYRGMFEKMGTTVASLSGTMTGMGEALDLSRSMLGKAYPNPFREETVIPYVLAERIRVDLAIYDMTGKLIRTLVSKEHKSGGHEVKWNGKNHQGNSMPAGIYICRMIAGDVVWNSIIEKYK